MMAGAEAVAFHNVTCRFDTPDQQAPVTALRDVTLSIRRHEFVAIVGPSGCGKSTLLRLAAGLLTPSAGTVTVHGSPMLQPRAEHAFVFQNPTLLPWADALQNVLLPFRLKRRGTNEAEAEAEAMALLRMAGLESAAKRLPEQLSGGMQQRVALCRALITDPSLLLMDEPFAALDALNREVLGLELLAIWERAPKTVLFVTHSISEAVLLADRVVVMSPHPGRVEGIVPIDLARPRPRNATDLPAFSVAAAHIRTLVFRRDQAIDATVQDAQAA